MKRLTRDELIDSLCYPGQREDAVRAMRAFRNDPEINNAVFSFHYNTRDPKLEALAAETAGIIAPEKAKAAFIKQSNNIDPAIRRKGQYGLGYVLINLDDSTCRTTVLKGLQDSDQTVCRAAAITAGKLGSDIQVLNALTALLRSNLKAFVRDEISRSAQNVRKRMVTKGNFNLVEERHYETRRFGIRMGREQKEQVGRNSHQGRKAFETYVPKAF